MKSPYQRHEDAAKRQEAYKQLSIDEKIVNCKNRRGKSSRELTKLRKLLPAK